MCSGVLKRSIATVRLSLRIKCQNMYVLQSVKADEGKLETKNETSKESMCKEKRVRWFEQLMKSREVQEERKVWKWADKEKIFRGQVGSIFNTSKLEKA